MDVNESFTGIVTIPLAGTPVQGDDVQSDKGFIFKACPGNRNRIWIFKWGDSKDNGFPLNNGEATVFVPVNSLDFIGFDSTYDGDKVCWIKAG
jgi:hypothetical protein